MCRPGGGCQRKESMKKKRNKKKPSRSEHIVTHVEELCEEFNLPECELFRQMNAFLESEIFQANYPLGSDPGEEVKTETIVACLIETKAFLISREANNVPFLPGLENKLRHTARILNEWLANRNVPVPAICQEK